MSLAKNTRVVIPLVGMLAGVIACSTDSSDRNNVAISASEELPSAFQVRVPELSGSPPPGDTLQLKRTLGDTTIFGRISSITPFNETILATDRFTSPHLALIDRETGDVIHHFGSEGAGPTEFQDPVAVSTVSRRWQEAWIYDMQNRRMSLLGIDSTGLPSIRDEFSVIPDEPIHRVWWQDGYLLGSGAYADYTLVMLNRTGDNILRKIAADPPFSKDDIGHFTGRRLLNLSRLVTAPSVDRFVLAYQWANRLDFFTKDGNRYGTLTGPRRTTTAYHVDPETNRFHWDERNQMSYVAGDATERFIYLLFCGFCTEEQQTPDIVHVFTWTGEFVKELALDKPAGVIAVEGDTLLIGSYMYKGRYPMLGEWRLSFGTEDTVR